jgi:hypothetical protein
MYDVARRNNKLKRYPFSRARVHTPFLVVLEIEEMTRCTYIYEYLYIILYLFPRT